LFEGFEGLLLFTSPGERSVFPEEASQGLGDDPEFLDEGAIKTAKSKK